MNKIKNKLCQVICFLTFSLSTQADLVVNLVLSPYVTRIEKSEYEKQIREFVLRAVTPGARVRVLDGWNLVEIGECTIPALAYDAPAARAQVKEVAGALRKLNAWISVDQPVDKLSNTASLKVPEILMTMDANQGSESVAILAGSPIYRNPQEEAFDFTESRYPSDGHLAATLTESVFGCAEKLNRIKGFAVHWILPSTEVFSNPLHRHRVARFWSLYIAEQGGQLESFAPGFAQVSSKCLGKTHRPYLTTTINQDDLKITMHAAQKRSVPQWILSRPAIKSEIQTNVPVPVPSVKVTQTNTSPAALQVLERVDPVREPVALDGQHNRNESPVKQSGQRVDSPKEDQKGPSTSRVHAIDKSIIPSGDLSKTGVGIAWAGEGVDLDLYLTPRKGAAEISYRRCMTHDGRLYKDERTGTEGKFYEYVELDGDLDSGSTIQINLYRGAGPVAVQVVFWKNGEIRFGEVTIHSGRGNRGLGDRSSNPCWVQVQLETLQPGTTPLVASKPQI